MTPAELLIVKDLLEAADEYAFDSCQEFCVHSIDGPGVCPTDDPRLEAARTLVEAEERVGR
jgi:hypothetical protein